MAEVFIMRSNSPSNCQKDAYGNPLPHYTPWATPDPLGSTFLLIPYRLDTTFTFFPPFVLLGPLLRYVVDQEFHGRRQSRPSQSIDFFWARRFLVQSYFSLPSVLKNGSPVLSSGTSGPSDVSASKYFWLTVPLIPRF